MLRSSTVRVSAPPLPPRTRPHGERVRRRNGRADARQRSRRDRRGAGRWDAEARSAVGRTGGVRPAEGVLRRGVGVRPLLPVADAALLQRQDDRRRRRGRPTRSRVGDAGGLGGRPDVDVHAEARHRVCAAARRRDRDRAGLHPSDGARGLRRMLDGRLQLLLLHHRGLRRVRGGRGRLDQRARGARRLDARRPHERAHGRPAVPDGDAGRGADPTAPRRPRCPRSASPPGTTTTTDGS